MTQLGGIRRILLATDLSETSDAAAGQALGLAHDLDAQLTILSVIEPGPTRSGGGAIARVDQLRRDRERAAQEIVAEGRGQGVTVGFLVWQGAAGEAIVDVASSEQVDLVVVGSHGRGSMGRLVLGSVSDYVVRRAPCPVLVVRTRNSPRFEPAEGSRHERSTRPATGGHLAGVRQRGPSQHDRRANQRA